MSDPQPKLTRQQIYDRIRESSKDEYILEEMIRLGFWPDDKDKPSLEQTLIKRRAELISEIRRLGLEQALYEDPQKALQALHKERKKQALENRELTRQRNNELRYQRAKQHFDKQQSDISFLGDGSATELAQQQTDQARLQQQELPLLTSPLQLAEAMGISLQELRFLSYYRDVAKIDHYRHFQLVKKTGGTRAIAAPMPRLKRAQYWILDNILNQLPPSAQAQGFIKARSIVSNAEPHHRKAVVINMDLKDFFPSITRNRVKGLFRGFGYSEQLSTILANLCTAPEREQLQLDNQNYYVAVSERRLPQGAPTSPMISNLICRNLDRRLQGTVDQLDVAYSRYADDLTFSFNSTNKNTDEIVKQLFWRVRQIISAEGFTLNHAKTRIMRSHQRQEVTGIVVNQQLNVDRNRLKAFRALLFQIEKNGFANKHWQGLSSDDPNKFLASIQGFANFVAMVHPEKGIPLQKKLIQLKRQHGIKTKQGSVMALNKKLFRLKAAQGKAPREDWWQAKPPQPPVKALTLLQIRQQKQQQQKTTEQAQTDSATPVNQESADSQPAHQKDLNLASRIAKAMILLAIGIVLLIFASLK